MASRRLSTVLVTAGLTAAVSFSGLSTAGALAPSGAGHFGEDGQAIAGAYWDAPMQVQPRAWTERPWPASSDVLAQLRAHGLDIILVEGYDDPKYERHAFLENSGSSVNAVMMHDTGTSVPASRLNNTHSLNWITYGVKNSKGKTVRACHFYVARDGSVYVVYLGRTWHAGAGDSMFGVPANRMNGYSYGIEIESQGGGTKDLTSAQKASASKVAAAALEVSGLGIDRIINHKTYAGRVQGKVDTAYSKTMWQDRIAAEMGIAVAPPAPAPVVSPNRKHISMGAMTAGTSSVYVQRYQGALRRHAKKRLKIKVKNINPSKATGYYGVETKQLTRTVKKKLSRSSKKWQRIWNNQPRGTPNKALVKKIGKTPIG
ncbi:MAG: hypothetical protein ACJAY5_001205 [Actinomycetes bacterium]|jgi:hypothetical protein